ncbi:hypothetical protein GCM10009760_52800 [Kitasatospora kazusensis]|uniref:Uncharacterized protein n=1 Tax=Kitasatospora kazusensis TaxID=407974 RepID=A0ABP5LYL1_9ACTN
MTPDRRPLALPAFSEPATDEPARPAGRRLLPVEQSPDFRQPPSEEIPAPRPARRPLGTGAAPSVADPDRQI